MSPTTSAAELVVDQHRPVPAVPVQGDQAVLADPLLGGQPGEVLVQRDARGRAASAYAAGTEVRVNQPKMSPTPLWPAS